MSYRILAVDPGSTSTKIGVFDDEKMLFEENSAPQLPRSWPSSTPFPSPGGLPPPAGPEGTGGAAHIPL